MLEKPETYEEAKIIIKNSTTSEMAELNKKLLKIRAGFITAIGLTAATAAEIVVNDPLVTIGFMPIFGTISLTSIVQYLHYLRNQQKINDDTFFDDKSEEEIMKMAEEYVESYNKFIPLYKGKGSSK